MLFELKNKTKPKTQINFLTDSESRYQLIVGSLISQFI